MLNTVTEGVWSLPPLPLRLPHRGQMGRAVAMPTTVPTHGKCPGKGGGVQGARCTWGGVRGKSCTRVCVRVQFHSPPRVFPAV